MLDFANPYLLSLLWLIPIIALLFWFTRMLRRRRMARFGNAETIAHLMPDASPYKPVIKLVLCMIALTSLIIVLARPRAGEKQHNENVNGIEIMIAFDLSNSMKASATDNPNATSRLDKARLVLEKLVNKLDNDKVGMVVFAGNAKTQFPMTTDFGMARIYLSELNPSLMPYQGTSLSEAISMSTNGFSADEDIHKSIILITDAEDHEGKAVEAAIAAAEKGIQINVIGLGSSKGMPIPTGDRNNPYISDSNGETVYTTINEELAKQIAKEGKGIYVNGAASDALDKLTHQLNKLEKSEFKNIKYSTAAEQFPIFAWIALIFLVVEAAVLERKNNWLRKYNFFSKK